jgi:hypothetical protein
MVISVILSVGRRHSSLRRTAVARSSAVFLIVFIATVTLFSAGSLLSASGGPQATVTRHPCDASLSAELGLSPTRLCLQDVQISVAPGDGSAFSVPVMVMKTSTSTTIEIQYLLSSESVGHTGPIENVTASDVPVALSVPSGKVSDSVTFSNASIVFANRDVIIYSYTLTALTGSDGYYAILPPYYYGVYPALAVGVNPDGLNATTLSTWGFTGMMVSGEFELPSSVVGTGDLVLVNATVPFVSGCPNPACVIISHSGF